VLLTTRPHKVPPATLFEPAASFIPVCPHPRVLSLDLTRYKSDRTEIRSRRPHDTSQPDAASFCGIRDVFYRWTKISPPVSPRHIDDDAVRNRGVVCRRRRPAPFSPHFPISPIDLTRYTSDPFVISSTRPHYSSKPDAAPICGIRGLFISWNKSIFHSPSLLVI